MIIMEQDSIVSIFVGDLKTSNLMLKTQTLSKHMECTSVYSKIWATTKDVSGDDMILS